MKWGQRIGVTTLACAGVLAIALLLTSTREPVYQGRRLSSWIDQYRSVNQDRHNEADRAIQQIGTNALPTLLEWIRYDEPPWRTRLINRLAVRGKAPAFLQKPALQKLVVGAAGRHARLDAMTGLHALGPAAYPAAFELLELTTSKSAFVSDNALGAIMSMQGQKALILAAGLTNSESTVRLRAAESVGLYFKALSSPRPRAFVGEPDLAMDPAPAIPLLISALRDPDVEVRRAATNTFQIIAPHGLAKDGKPAMPVPFTVLQKVTIRGH